LIASDAILEIRVLCCMLPNILGSCVLTLQRNDPNLVSMNNLVPLIYSKMVLVKFVGSLGSDLHPFLLIFYLALSNV
jgi:hypothetical protein